MDWFLYDNGLCHERVNTVYETDTTLGSPETDTTNMFRLNRNLITDVKNKSARL